MAVPRTAERQRRGARDEHGEGTAAEADAYDEQATGAGGPGERDYPRRRRRRARLGPLSAVLLAVALIGVAAYGAYLFVPTATIRLQPDVTAVGPVSGEVIADPLVAIVDPGEGVIPARTISVPLSVGDDFSATGNQVIASRATGSVRFRSTNTVSEVPVPAGTRVSTDGGTAFETTEAVIVPRAVFDTGTPGTVDAAIRAVRAGPRGNVDEGQISVLPASLADQQVSVNNPRPTTGGTRVQESVVQRADYDSALEALGEQIELELASELQDPSLAPLGLTVYPASASLGEVTPSLAPGDVVGSVAEGFTLGLTAEATVLAVDESLVDQVTLEQLRALVPAGAQLLGGSIAVSHAPGEVRSGRVAFTVSAHGSAYRQPDRDLLLDEIRGKTVAEARAIMGTYGDVEVAVWPEFIDRLPDQASRINLTIVPPTETP